MMSMDDCQRFEALLDSQILDEIPLSADEKNFFDHHTERCSQCAASSAILLEMQDTGEEASEYDPSDAYLERMARRVLEKEAVASPWADLLDEIMSFLTPRQWVLTGASAACLVLLMAAWISFGHRSQGPAYLEFAQVAKVTGQATLSDQRSQSGAVYRQGDEIAVASGALWMNFNNGTKVMVKKDSAIKLLEASRQKTHFVLRKGQVIFHVSPLSRGQEFLIESEAGKLNVIGTTFEVGVSQKNEFIRVTEGKVRFESNHGRIALIHAGQGFDLDRGIYNLSEPARNAVDGELNGSVAPNSEPADSHETAPLVATPDRVPPAPAMEPEPVAPGLPKALSAPSRARPPAPRKSSPLASSPHNAAPARTLPAAQAPEEPTARGYSPSGSNLDPRPSVIATFKPSIGELLQQSRQLRQDKDFGSVVAIYQKIIEFYPSSAEARSCWVWMGKVQLENLADPTKALRALERPEEEIRALNLFEARFPESAYMPRVKARLVDLSSP